MKFYKRHIFLIFLTSLGPYIGEVSMTKAYTKPNQTKPKSKVNPNVYGLWLTRVAVWMDGRYELFLWKGTGVCGSFYTWYLVCPIQ